MRLLALDVGFAGAESYYDYGDASGTVEIDFKAGVEQRIRLVGDVTVEWKNRLGGRSFFLLVEQDETGGRKITFPEGTFSIGNSEIAAGGGEKTLLRVVCWGDSVFITKPSYPSKLSDLDVPPYQEGKFLKVAEDGSLMWAEASGGSGSSSGSIVGDTDPKPDTDPEADGAICTNYRTGKQWVCIDSTPGRNKWVGVNAPDIFYVGDKLRAVGFDGNLHKGCICFGGGRLAHLFNYSGAVFLALMDYDFSPLGDPVKLMDGSYASVPNAFGLLFNKEAGGYYGWFTLDDGDDTVTGVVAFVDKDLKKALLVKISGLRFTSGTKFGIGAVICGFLISDHNLGYDYPTFAGIFDWQNYLAKWWSHHNQNSGYSLAADAAVGDATLAVVGDYNASGVTKPMIQVVDLISGNYSRMHYGGNGTKLFLGSSVINSIVGDFIQAGAVEEIGGKRYATAVQFSPQRGKLYKTVSAVEGMVRPCYCFTSRGEFLVASAYGDESSGFKIGCCLFDISNPAIPIKGKVIEAPLGATELLLTGVHSVGDYVLLVMETDAAPSHAGKDTVIITLDNRLSYVGTSPSGWEFSDAQATPLSAETADLSSFSPTNYSNVQRSFTWEDTEQQTLPISVIEEDLS